MGNTFQRAQMKQLVNNAEAMAPTATFLSQAGFEAVKSAAVHSVVKSVIE